MISSTRTQLEDIPEAYQEQASQGDTNWHQAPSWALASFLCTNMACENEKTAYQKAEK
jgi:hypothetical protein